MVLESLPGMGKPVISIDGTNSTIRFDPMTEGTTWSVMQPTLKIYGPTLDSLTVKQGWLSYSGKTQDLSIETVGAGSSVNLQRGTYGKLTIKASEQSSVDASNVTVLAAVVDGQTGSTVSLGTVKSLAVTQNEACPIGGNAMSVNVHAVNTGVMDYNGVSIKANTHETNCGTVQVGDIYADGEGAY